MVGKNLFATLDVRTNEEKKTFDDTQDSTDRKRARALEVDDWLIRLLTLMLQLKVLKKLFVTAKH